MLQAPNTRCIALYDVDDTVLARRGKEVTEGFGNKPALYKDYRALLDNQDVDPVIVGTPDHWHCLQMIDACSACKDVYVEKLMANSIEECNRMVAATDYYEGVVQVGQWQRSGAHWQ
jgi:predicted dehydrogenase